MPLVGKVTVCGLPPTSSRADGLTLTVTASAVAPAVIVKRCFTFAGRRDVEPSREDDTEIDGLASAAEGSASRARMASASERVIAQLDHSPLPR